QGSLHASPVAAFVDGALAMLDAQRLALRLRPGWLDDRHRVGRIGGRNHPFGLHRRQRDLAVDDRLLLRRERHLWRLVGVQAKTVSLPEEELPRRHIDERKTKQSFERRRRATSRKNFAVVHVGGMGRPGGDAHDPDDQEHHRRQPGAEDQKRQPPRAHRGLARLAALAAVVSARILSHSANELGKGGAPPTSGNSFSPISRSSSLLKMSKARSRRSLPAELSGCRQARTRLKSALLIKCLRDWMTRSAWASFFWCTGRNISSKYLRTWTRTRASTLASFCRISRRSKAASFC